MNIVMIGPKAFPSRQGGIDVVVGRLSCELAKHGHKVVVYTHRNKGDKKTSNINGCLVKPIITVTKKSIGTLIYSFFATLKGLCSKADVIHFHAEGNTFFLWMTKFSKKRIIVTCHGIDWKREKFKGFGSKILLKSEKRIVKYADEIITLSKKDSDYFASTYRKKTILIPNGFEYFDLVKPDLIKTLYGVEGNDYFLFLARIVPEKGLHYLIEAYNKINVEQKLIIAGGISQSDAYFQRVKALANNNKKIIFTGFVDGKILSELYSNAFLYVLPSDIEGMPMSLLEALGHHRVCLVSDIDENKIDLENSYLFPRGDVDALATMLSSISICKKNFSQNDAQISWDEVVSKTINVYENEDINYYK